MLILIFIITKRDRISMVRKDKAYKTYLCILNFFLCFFVQALLFFKDNDISIIEDRIGDFALPSYLAGLDWSVLIAQTKYYGYGMKWIFFPLFVLTDDPHIIFCCVTFIYIFLMARIFLFVSLII